MLGGFRLGNVSPLSTAASINPAVLNGHDIVCFSSIDWQFIWQGHQEIMSTLAANGNRVLFVENTGVRAPSLKDLPRVRDRIRNWRRGTKGFRVERDNLFIYSPLLLPFPYSSLVRVINRTLFVRALRRWMRAAGFARPIVWTFLPTPLVREIIPLLDPVASVYYCIDDFASSSPAARRIAGSEEQLFRDVDLVFVTSEKLRARAAQFSRHVTLFPFGVSMRKFERVRTAPNQIPPDLAALPRPIVGYVGGVHRWVDFDLLRETARRMPATTFVLVGPLQVEHDPSEGISNLHMFGKRSHDDVPRYIKGFDVGIVPYLRSEYTSNVYPTKLNEYFAMGIPVVSTDLPEIRRFNAKHGSRVSVADTAEEFVAAITDSLQPRSDDERAIRIDVARSNSWESRIADMSVLVRETLAEKRSRREPWEVTLKRMYRRARGRVAAMWLAAAVVYVALFHTSLVWTLAEPLRVSAQPERADAVVVLAGGMGESGQAGGGYQERVKTAVDMYKAGYAPNMVFVSGYTFAFKEAEIMRDLALASGVPASAIVLETDAANTYDGIVHVSGRLRDHGWHHVLLVSSPYHMRRALAVWAAQAPDMQVVPMPVPVSQFYAHDRGAKLEQIRGIAQEYAALGYYWVKGWI
jgi:uncharacterized SAM-binding protein YcdF (DUF218 family)/glycosyltransferase involved in cell wall biosynthesis